MNENMTKEELIKEIASKSNLNLDDVQKVLKELEGLSESGGLVENSSADNVGDGDAASEDDVVSGGSIVFACPDCGAVISALPASAGQDGECPFCKSKIKIPQKSIDVPTVGAVSATEPEAVLEESAEGFVLFACQECGQEMECAASMAGLTAGCPSCGSKVVIPSASTIESKSSESSKAGDDDFSDMSSSVTMRIDLMDL